MRYKDYKKVDIPWLNEVPSHWEITRIKKIFYIFKDITYKKNPVVLSLARDKVKIRNIENNQGQLASSYNNYNTVKIGDLLLNPMDLYSGANCNVSYYNGVISPSYINLRTKEYVCIKYFDYLFKLQYTSLAFQSVGKGVSKDNRWTLSNDTLLNYQIIAPPKEEQEQIARFLDWKINEIDRLIIEYKQKIQNVNKLKSRLIANEYNNFTKKIRLKMILDKSMEYGLNMSGDLSGNFRYVRITDIDKNGNLKNNEKRYVSDIDKRYILSEGDILFARSGATVGKTYYYKEKYGDCAYAGYLIRATVNKDIVFPEYIYYFTQSGIYEEWKNAIFIQSTIQNISAEKYSNLLIPMLDKDDQLSVIKNCRAIINNIERVEKKQVEQIEKLKQLKQSIISDVVTGKIDVRNIEIPKYEKDENIDINYDKEEIEEEV